MRDKYEYEVGLTWKGERSGIMESSGLPSLEVSAPPEFAGQPGRWTPEQLLVGATSSCLMTTFLAIAEFSKITVSFFRAKATGRLEKIAGEGYRFIEIHFVPEIGVSTHEVEKARRALAKAEKSCFVSNSLKATVSVEPVFVPVEAEEANKQ